MRRKSLGAICLFALVVAGCGADDGSDSRAPDEPVLQITSEGGFVPLEWALANGPRYTLLGDGSLIFQGVQTMQFPGPLVPPYMLAQLSASQMSAVLAMVDDIGLADIDSETDDSANNVVADASTETIVYWDENGEHRYSVYALGLEEEPSARNAAFLELVDTFDRFTAETPADPYEPDQLRVLGGPGFVDEAVPDLRPWPLDDDWDAWAELEIGWTCRVFGPEVLDSFGDATQATVWEIPDVFSYSAPARLLVRPLLPGETDCP